MIYNKKDEKEVAIKFILDNKSIIDVAFMDEISPSTIYFLIILKEDTLENRGVFYDFLDDYLNLENDNKIHFKFKFFNRESAKTLEENKRII